jgi:hypothetical protein
VERATLQSVKRWIRKWSHEGEEKEDFTCRKKVPGRELKKKKKRRRRKELRGF